MRLNKLAQIFSIKYKSAASTADLEASLRNKINILWDYANKRFNILKICADSGASKPKNANEQKAVEGYRFCKQLLSMLDYLKNNRSNISLGEFREVLVNITKLIDKNKDLKFNEAGKPSVKGEVSSTQFPHVSELIFQIIPVSKKHDVKLRDEQYSKARTGLSRILSLSLSTLNDMDDLERISPEKFIHTPITKVDIDEPLPQRFSPQRSPISEYDIIDFIRQHGDKYGLSSKEDWATVFMDDPQLKESMTTVINAINRGHYPVDSPHIKMQIAEILKQHEERKSSNAPLFEDID